MAKLEVTHLNKTYSPKIVPVKDLSLAVEDGEFLTLLGPSGCGKSTTLRLIAGLEQPTRGEVLIGSKNVTHRSAGDRNIAMVFQSYALYPHMTVFENIASGLKLRKTPVGEIQQRVAEASRVLDLDGLMQRKPSKLSGGQRQRVALGRALVRKPDVFLLDEPLSNLDALLREQVRAELKQLFQSQNTPVVYVTHDQTEAMTLSTKVAVLYKGDLQQLDSPQRIYSHPANQFVAGFIGSPQMNLLTLPCENSHALLGEARVPLPQVTEPQPAGQIVLGIRPEHLQVGKQPDCTAVRGQVFLIENLGMSDLVSMHVQNSELTLRALIANTTLKAGDELVLSLPPQQLHWFDIETRSRIPVQPETVAH